MRFWPFEKSDVPAVASASDPVPGFIYCCKGNIGLSYAYVRAAWKYVGIQHVGDGGPDAELYSCTLCWTTRGIDIVCPGGKDHQPLTPHCPPGAVQS